MAAVLGLDDGEVDTACRRAAADVWVANFNAPGQVVIAGDPDAVELASEIARSLGAKRVLPVAVSGAFHTPYMAPARDRLRSALAEVDIRDLEAPVVANVDGLPHTDHNEWAGLLSAQLCSPVQWRRTLYQLADAGVTTFVELGPGTILSGMARRTIEGARVLSVAAPADLDSLLETLAGHPAAEVVHEGEHLFMTERVVVSPAAGVFVPVIDTRSGGHIDAGQLLGRVGDAEVRSPFAGKLQGFLAYGGERVIARQPIAWLLADVSEPALAVV
jgi:[acyl-carrier-protein] S-malonyltransferase